nr:hypothetical protein [Tanacetum cinerariifolium]
MELAVEQHCEEKSKVQTKMENVLQENDRLLTQALSVEIVNIVVHDNVMSVCLNVNACAHCVTTESELKLDFFKKEDYETLLQKYQTLEKHCITLEINNQLNTEIFQKDTLSSNASAPTFAELFEINDLKAQAQAKDTLILKLKEKLNSLKGDVKDRHVKQNVEESETLNIELGHQEKVLVITTLKEQLDKLKGKAVITEAVSLNPIDHKLLKVGVIPVVSKLRKNRTAHIDYIRHTQGEAATLRKIVERVNLVSSASGSMSQDNTKNNRILQTQKRAKKNKVEDHLRTVKSSLNKASFVDSKATSSVLNSVSNVNSNLKCASSNGCLFSDNNDTCVGAYKTSVNASKKSKSVKTPVIRKIWKTTGKVFKTVGHIWKPTGRTFTLVGQVCPLTRIATPTIEPYREPIPIVNKTEKPVVTLVVQIVLWYLDSDCSKHMTGDRSQLVNFVQKFLGTVKFRNDHVANIIGQFCDSDLEVAFRQHTCFIHNLDGVDLLTGSRGNNLYTLSLQEMMASSPICLLSKASKTKSWLWHRRLSHLNFGAINHLARQGLVRGLPKLKFEKDHLCSACAMGKSTRKTHKPKYEDTNQEKLYLLYMDLCGPMRVESVNGKKYIIVIVDDYSRFTWQIGVVERRNRTLIEAARTMLIYAQALLFLWAEAVATACFTQNRSIIRLRHGKTPYELLHNKLPGLSFFHVFGALRYPTNDSENLGKLQPKADIGIFIGYAPTKKAFRIYNRRTRRIVETIHVDFDELTTMASEQRSLGPALNEITPRTISSGFVHITSPSTSYVPPLRNDWDFLFQPMFDELLNPPPSGVNQAPEAIASIIEVIPLVNADSTGSTSSTMVEQDAPSTSNSSTPTESQSSIIPQDVGDDNLDMEVAHMGSDSLVGIPIPEINSEQSTTPVSPQAIVQTDHPLPHTNSKWTKDHPLNNIIGQLDRPVSTRLQLHEQALFCYYDAFLTSVEPKTYKEALAQSCWIEAMQEELHEFERLEVCELVPRPDKVIVITLKWIYKVKLDKLGGILKNKARLVARGYRQERFYYQVSEDDPGTAKGLGSSEKLGKLQPKADIGIFIGYASSKKAFRIYKRRTRRIVETIHVDFDEMTTMASEQRSSGPALNEMTPGIISSGLVRTTSPSTSYVPPSRNDWDLLFQPMFDELLNPPPSVVNQAPEAFAPIDE